MKKLFFSALCCLMIVSLFSSCNKKKDEPQDTKKYFTIEVSNVQAISATVTITPADMDMTYLYGVVPTADYNEDSITSRYNKAFFDDIIEYYEWLYEEDLNYSDIFYIGKDQKNVDDLTPQTDYTVFAIGIDTVSFKPSTPVVTVTFRTPKFEKKGDKELTFEGEMLFVDHVADMGWWQFYGYNQVSDTKIYFLTVSPTETMTVNGTYTMEDMDTDYTYMSEYTVVGNDTTGVTISFIEGTFNVSETATGAEMEAVVLGDDGYEYTLHVAGVYEEEDDMDYAPARRKANARRATAVRRNRFVGTKK